MMELVEVAIGLIFVFLLVSLIVTAINEIFSRLRKLRARTLWKGIRVIIDNDALRKNFYENGLIVIAKRAAAAEMVDKMDEGHPSYIAPRTFAKAMAMATGLRTSGVSGQPRVALAQVQDTVAKMENDKIRDVLISALSDAGGKLENFEKSLEVWYQDAMDRLSGDYKRAKQTASFVIGLAIAVTLNIDALDMALKLNSDSELRAALVASAVEFIEEGDFKDECQDAGEERTEEEALSEIDCFADRIGSLSNTLAVAPIGWPDERGEAVFAAYEEAVETLGKDDSKAPALRPVALFLIAKLLGWLTTAFAVTLGAPFWFDVLKRFVNIRSSGKKPVGQT